MRGRYFRYLFENQNGGLLHTGSVYDKEKHKSTNCLYMVGSYCRNTHQKKKNGMGRDAKEHTVPEAIDILVMGCYTAAYINKLMDILKHHMINTVILPYLAPIQRLLLVEEGNGAGKAGRNFMHFLQDPYQFLKGYGIKNIYFLYGNGEIINREPEELESGFHFELADQRTLQLIREMEGYLVPVVRAGYIIENGWLFYFGVYGLDIQALSMFTREYFSSIDNIHQTSDNVNEDYTIQMKRLLQEYLRKYGNSPATTVTMFEGPLYAFPNENESFMTEKEFCEKECSKTWQRYDGDTCCMCTISCIHNKDYDTMQRHKGRDIKESRFGILMLGNANLNRYLSEIVARFWRICPRIRGISVPNCGSGEDWNYQILSTFEEKDRTYWICGKHDITSPGVVSDIVLSTSRHRFLTVNEGFGCCLSGYIIPREDID